MGLAPYPLAKKKNRRWLKNERKREWAAFYRGNEPPRYPFFSSHIILYPLATPCPATVSRGGGRQILRAVSPLFACPKCCRKAKCDGSRSLRPPHWINTRPTRYVNVSNCRSSDFPIHPSSKSVPTQSTQEVF